MKKICFIFVLMLFTINIGFAEDKYSKDYLQNRKHFAVMTPLAEFTAERALKSSLKKETGTDFDVKFDGYTFSSMKKGIFKSLEITGKNVVIEGVNVPYLHIETLSDYNYIDYTQNPVAFKSDVDFKYDLVLTEESMNSALAGGDYRTALKGINFVAYPLFEVKSVKTKIVDNKLHIFTEYNFPIAPASKNRVFVTSSDIAVSGGKISAENIKLDSGYGKLSLVKVANLLNLLNPLEYTLKVLDNQKCNGNIENVNIIDNKVKVDGKIFVKGDQP